MNRFLLDRHSFFHSIVYHKKAIFNHVIGIFPLSKKSATQSIHPSLLFDATLFPLYPLPCFPFKLTKVTIIIFTTPFFDVLLFYSMLLFQSIIIVERIC
jgi:hypothetical protein